MRTSVLALIAVFTQSVFTAPSNNPNDDSYRHPANGQCVDYSITEEVTWTKAIWALPKLENNFVVAALRANISSLDIDFHPFSGTVNVTSTYTLAGTFCTPINKTGGKESIVLLATHGIGYDSRYWTSTYKPDEYNFVQHSLASGYSVFYYDRLGTGRSQIVSGYEAQASNQVELLAKTVENIRSGRYAKTIIPSKIVLVGHSFGSILSGGVLAKYPDIVEGAVLTGFALPNATDPSHVLTGTVPILLDVKAASSFRPPLQLDSGYVGFGDIYSHAQGFFHQPFDIPTIEYAQSIIQPASPAEVLSGNAIKFDSPAYKGKMLITTGEFDLIGCGGNCAPRFEYGVQNNTYPSTKVETYLHPGAGHGINFARNATGFYATILDFLDRNM